MTSRNDWLTCDDPALLKQCSVDTYRASGPGGQKRNKTSSAVRLRHEPSGLMVIAEESRSQHENKARALGRLRRAIAWEIRIDASDEACARVIAAHVTPDGTIEIARRSPDRPLLDAAILDRLDAAAGRLQEAARSIGVSTAQLSKYLGEDGKLLAAANRIRERHGQGRLK